MSALMTISLNASQCWLLGKALANFTEEKEFNKFLQAYDIDQEGERQVARDLNDLITQMDERLPKEWLKAGARER